jgi:hypothetical protein
MDNVQNYDSYSGLNWLTIGGSGRFRNDKDETLSFMETKSIL